MPSILLKHPAPYRHVPLRARAARDVYEAVRTPARIHAVDEAEMRPIGVLEDRATGRRVELHEHAGQTWVPFMGPLGTRPVLERYLVAFLEGDDVRIGAQGMPDPLRWTPLHHHDGPPGHVPSRGLEPGGTDAVQIVHDDRDRARATAAAWVERELRLAGGKGWIRLRGPIAFPAVGGAVGMPGKEYEAAVDPMARDGLGFEAMARADAIEAHAAHWRATADLPWLEDPGERPRLVGLDVPFADLPGIAEARDEVAAACTKGLVEVLDSVRKAVSAAGPALRDARPIHEARGMLALHALRAPVSGVDPAEHGEVLLAMDGLLRATLARIPEGNRLAGRLRRQAGWISAALLPGLARAVDADGRDVEALSGLAP